MLLVYTIGYVRTPWYSTHGTSDGKWCRPTAAGVPIHNPRHRRSCNIPVKMCQIIQKCVVFEIHIDLHYRFQEGVRSLRHNLRVGSRAACRNVTKKEGDYCLSNAMHNIGQSIKSPECPSVRPTFFKLSSFHLPLSFPFPFPFPFSFSFSFLFPSTFPFPFSFSLFSFPFPFLFSFLLSFFSSPFPFSLPFHYLSFPLSFPLIFFFPFPFLFPFHFSFPFPSPLPSFFFFPFFLSFRVKVRASNIWGAISP